MIVLKRTWRSKQSNNDSVVFIKVVQKCDGLSLSFGFVYVWCDILSVTTMLTVCVTLTTVTSKSRVDKKPTSKSKPIENPSKSHFQDVENLASQILTRTHRQSSILSPVVVSVTRWHLWILYDGLVNEDRHDLSDFMMTVLKNVTMARRGIKNCPKLCDVIYGRHLCLHTIQPRIWPKNWVLSLWKYAKTHWLMSTVVWEWY